MNPFEVLGIPKTAAADTIRQAYLQMVRRWHPDRFAEGPERMWAEQKMTEINVAYEQALNYSASRSNVLSETGPEKEQLDDVRQLMAAGQLVAARHALMRVSFRSAEWNYLFGAVLLRLGEYEKAVLYFGIASRQCPKNNQYRTAYLSAEAMRNRHKKPAPLVRRMARHLARGFNL